MTLDQLSSLTEDELALALYVVNVLFPVEPKIEVPPHGLVWFRPGVLEKKIGDSFPRLKPEYHGLFSSLLNKLGVKHEIRYEQPNSGSKT